MFIHATGRLSSVASGILEGTVEFPVRGSISLRIERRPNDGKGECAALYVLGAFPSQADLVLIQPMPDDPDPTPFWHGGAVVQGYHFQVRAVRCRGGMDVAFSDVKQPFWGPEALEVGCGVA